MAVSGMLTGGDGQLATKWRHDGSSSEAKLTPLVTCRRPSEELSAFFLADLMFCVGGRSVGLHDQSDWWSANPGNDEQD